MAEHELTPEKEMLGCVNSILVTCARVKEDVACIEREAEELRARLKAGHEGPVKAPVQRPVQPSQHLREHRPGRPKKLAADPDLRAFVEARFNRMTFDQIADDVAQNFPPERQVKRSAIHDWYRRVYKRKYQAGPG